MNTNYLSKKYWTGKLLPSCVFLLFLATSNIAWGNYIPPKKPSRPSTPTGSDSGRGRGSCSNSANTELAVLAPASYFGQAVSIYPTFAWFVPKEELPNKPDIEFSIYEYDVNTNDKKGSYIQRLRQPSIPGIMKISLDKEKPGLVVGQKYFWQVKLICEENDDSKSIIVNAVVEVVATSPGLKLKLSDGKSSLKRAEVYAKEGLWYEALSTTLEGIENKEYQLKLLEQLSNSEQEEARGISNDEFKIQLEKQALNLRRIVNDEKKQ
ncbi:hypothetical protein NIES37_67570 [Tolypothrix tenuis PCC 7101]|uniref:DUF928 domain-containing protein n=1 Tax=Tolypothrix tenuis PCC 7101 TaxID=231146 RepID=A0A1Z4NAJ2_9CYAN|nr:DUF928 domain-containing protein [Aulosira sp. FACHB-113]BAZ02744.1 hypothetical protein NIES37_67570 [Tolypothrix tenuis PCC 7101]BAZ78363.1 hypothetical protein NIES50_69960 [Aulosira laxa NIES-50]